MSSGDGFYQTKPHTFFFRPSVSPLQSLFPPLPQIPFGGSWKGTITVLPFSFAAALITVLLFPVLLAVKRLYLHPLSRYNRPPFWAVTRVPYTLAFRNDQLAHKTQSLRRHGPRGPQRGFPSSTPTA
ncbi:hypothetical protein RU639_003856 [Aspergillus parasiticus]